MPCACALNLNVSYDNLTETKTFDSYSFLTYITLITVKTYLGDNRHFWLNMHFYIKQRIDMISIKYIFVARVLQLTLGILRIELQKFLKVYKLLNHSIK